MKKSGRRARPIKAESQRAIDNLLHRTQILNPLDSGGYQFLIAC